MGTDNAIGAAPAPAPPKGKRALGRMPLRPNAGGCGSGWGISEASERQDYSRPRKRRSPSKLRNGS